jgi:hypothetical protein
MRPSRFVYRVSWAKQSKWYARQSPAFDLAEKLRVEYGHDPTVTRFPVGEGEVVDRWQPEPK